MIFNSDILMLIIYKSPLYLLVLSLASFIIHLFLHDKIEKMILPTTINSDSTTEVGFFKTIEMMATNSIMRSNGDYFIVLVFSLITFLVSFWMKNVSPIEQRVLFYELGILIIFFLSIESAIMVVFYNNTRNIIRKSNSIDWVCWIVWILCSPLILIFGVIAFVNYITQKLNKSVIGCKYFFTDRFNKSIDRYAISLLIKMLVFVFIAVLLNQGIKTFEALKKDDISNISESDVENKYTNDNDEIKVRIERVLLENENEDKIIVKAVIILYFALKLSFIISDYISFIYIRISSDIKDRNKRIPKWKIEKRFFKDGNLLVKFSHVLRQKFGLSLGIEDKYILVKYLYYDRYLYLSDVRIIRKCLLYIAIIVCYWIFQNGILTGLMIIQCTEDMIVFLFLEPRAKTLSYQYFSNSLDLLENITWKSCEINLIDELITPDYLLLEEKYMKFFKDRSTFDTIRLVFQEYDDHIKKIQFLQQFLKENELSNQLLGNNQNKETVIKKTKDKIENLKKENINYLEKIYQLAWNEEKKIWPFIAVRYIAYISTYNNEDKYFNSDDLENLLNILSRKAQLAITIESV